MIRKRIVCDRIPGNRIPQFYPQAVKEVFGAKGNFIWVKQDKFRTVVSSIDNRHVVQMCLKKPGHYIAALAYDTEKKCIIYNDPWSGRSGLKNDGFNEEMYEDEFERNVQDFFIVYWK
jgi:hypothetical protein